jgi:hypothetical protein
MIPTDGITAILVAANVGVIPPAAGDWPIYEGQFPSEVDQCIMVREFGGRSSEVRIAIDYPSVQILVRGTERGYVTSRAKIEDIFLALQGIPSAPAEYPELTSAVAVGGRTFAGYDEKGRPQWTVNFNLIESKNPQGYRDL